MSRARVEAIRAAGRAAAWVLGLALAGGGCGRPAPEKEYQQVLQALHKGELERGKARLESLLEQYPEASFAAEAQNWLGLVYWELGQLTEAAERFELAAKQNPSAFAPAYNLGCLALEQGDMPRGVALLRRAADLDPQDIRALLKIGEWTTRNGRWDLAQRMYYEAQRRSPQSAAAATGLGRIALLNNDLPQAETFFMQALEWVKDYPPALYNLGVLHAQRENHREQAREYFRQYLAVAPQGERAAAAAARLSGQSPPQSSFQPPVAPPSKSLASVAWLQAQDALDSSNREAAYGQVLRALEMAREGGDLAQFGEILRRALGAFGDRAAIQLEAGEFWLRQNQPRRALAALLKAQALEPDNPLVLLKLARCSAELAEYDTAVVSLRRLVQLEPGNPDALWELAQTYGDKLGMISKGVAAYRDFERRFPADPRAAEVPDRIQALESSASGGS